MDRISFEAFHSDSVLISDSDPDSFIPGNGVDRRREKYFAFARGGGNGGGTTTTIRVVSPPKMMDDSIKCANNRTKSEKGTECANAASASAASAK